MKNLSVRALSVLLSVLMLFMMIPFTAVSAEAAADTGTETITPVNLLDGEEISITSASGYAPATIAYSAEANVTTVTTTSDFTDKDHAHFLINLADVNVESAPYVVVGMSNSAITDTKIDMSINLTNGYFETTDTSYAEFRLYGKTFSMTNTITNVVIDATAYTGGDKAYVIYNDDGTVLSRR